MLGDRGEIKINQYIVLPINNALTLWAPTQQNSQSQWNNSSPVGDELFECVWPFCRAGASRDKVKLVISKISKQNISFKVEPKLSLSYCNWKKAFPVDLILNQ